MNLMRYVLAFYARQLDRQLALIERMVDFIQLDSGLSVPKPPNNTGKYFCLGLFPILLTRT